MTEEPHRSRRKAIMKAHPEVCIDSRPFFCWDSRGHAEFKRYLALFFDVPILCHY